MRQTTNFKPFVCKVKSISCVDIPYIADRVVQTLQRSVVVLPSCNRRLSPAAYKIRRLGRKSREHELDRTPYKGDRKISFVARGPSP